MERLKYILWNEQQRRLRMFWRLSVTVLIFTILLVLLAIAISVFAVARMLASGDSMQAVLMEMSGSPGFQVVDSLFVLLAVLVGMWITARLLDRRPFADFGFHLDRDWWIDLGFGLALGALLMVGIFLTEWGAGWITITGTLQTASPSPSFILMLFQPLALFLAVGIYEELISRGYLLQNLAEGFNWPILKTHGAIVVAWLLSSVLFGLGHADNPNATAISTFNLILAGVFLGLGYVLTGELAIPIGLHITWNFFQGAVFGFPVSGMAPATTFIAITQGGPDLWTGGAFGPEAGLLGIFAILVGGLFVWLWVYWRKGETMLQASIARPPIRLNTEETQNNVPSSH
jgi:membrane protease YdiL (CAAX protease family)